MSRGAATFAVILPLLLACAACGGDSPSSPSGPEPVASVDVSPTTANLVVGETIQLSATPRSGSGAALTGRVVTWASMSNGVASVDGSGKVTAVGVGSTDVTATSEGHSASASITVSPKPVAAVEIDPAGPIDLFVGQMVQLTATTKDDEDNVLTDRDVTWSSDPEGVVTVDGDGLVTADAAGSTDVSATSEGVVASVTVNVAEPGPVVIAQVSPGTLVEGQAATITGTGFHPTAGLNTVSVDGVAAVVNQATSTTLDITVPSFACRPKRAVDVVVTVGGEASPPAAATARPSAFLEMEVGEQVTLTDPADLCLQFDDALGAERYLVGVQSVSEVASTLNGVRVAGEAGAGVASPPLPAPASMRSVGLAGTIDPVRAQRWARHQAAEMAFMERSRELLEPGRQARTSLPSRLYRSGPALIPGDITVGTEVPLRFPDFNGNSCTDFTDITVVVRKVGTRVIIVEDKDDPAGGLEAQDFEDLASDFDGSIYLTDTSYFGEPTDTDANERVVVVLTKEVNQLEGPLAFVSAADLFPTTSCAASNEGEYYYSTVPDPTGMVGDTRTLEDARLQGRTLLAHEFTHIIQAGRRMAAGGQFMTSYMAEGGATAAEQYSGFAFEGRSEGQNLTTNVIYEAFGADPHSYYGFMGDFISYFGGDFNGGRNADAPEQCTWVGMPLMELGPCTGSGRLVYGITFSVVQHAIDVYGPGLGGPQAIQKALVDYAGPPGFAALEAVFGVSAGQLMAHWAPMLYIDDRFADASLDEFQFLNWNLRSLEAAWGVNSELQPRARGFTDFSDDVSVRSASTAFFDVSGAGRSATAIRFTDQVGADLPATFQVFVVRVE